MTLRDLISILWGILITFCLKNKTKIDIAICHQIKNEEVNNLHKISIIF